MPPSTWLLWSEDPEPNRIDLRQHDRKKTKTTNSLWKLDSKGSSHRETSAHWWTNAGWKQVRTRLPSPLWVLTPATVYFYSLHSAPSTLCWCDLAYSDWALRGQPAPIGGLPWLHEIFIKQHKHAPSARRQRDASCLVTSERWPKSWRLSEQSGKTQHGSARGGPTHAGVCSLIVVLLVLSMNWTRLTLSLRRTAATLFCRLSHLWFPSWTMTFSLLAASVRFSRARRRYCLLTSSSWVRRSWTCRWNAWEDDIKEEKSSECDANASCYRNMWRRICRKTWRELRQTIAEQNKNNKLKNRDWFHLFFKKIWTWNKERILESQLQTELKSVWFISKYQDDGSMLCFWEMMLKE